MKTIRIDGDNFLDKEGKGNVLEALLNGLLEAAQEEESECGCCEDCDSCSGNTDEDDCTEKVKGSFAQFMRDVMNYNPEERNIDGKYDFIDMIDEFSNGYNGTFTDGNVLYTYDNVSKTLLVQTASGTFPASLTSQLVNNVFTKKKVLIAREKALELITGGKTANFEVEMFGRKYTGHLTVVNDIPKYKIFETQDIIVSDEMILLGALLSGKWYL